MYRIAYSANDSEIFSINPDTGEIFVSHTPLNQGIHTIIVNASDQPNDPNEMKYSLAVVTITVLMEGNHY